MKIQLEIETSTAWIWFSDPRGLNPMGTEFFNELEQALIKVEKESSVRCLIVGAQGKHLSVGLDLKEFATSTPENLLTVMMKAGQVFGRIANLPFPTLCMYKGFSVGGAIEMGLGCDFRIASEDVQISIPGVRIGIFNPAVTCFRLPRAVGLARAKELLLGAKTIDANTAKEWGMVYSIVPQDKLIEAAKEWRDSILSLDPLALSLTKSLLEMSWHSDVSAFRKIEEEHMKTCVLRETPIALMRNFWKK